MIFVTPLAFSTRKILNQNAQYSKCACYVSNSLRTFSLYGPLCALFSPETDRCIGWGSNNAKWDGAVRIPVYAPREICSRQTGNFLGAVSRSNRTARCNCYFLLSPSPPRPPPPLPLPLDPDSIVGTYTYVSLLVGSLAWLEQKCQCCRRPGRWFSVPTRELFEGTPLEYVFMWT